jgi:hypothetical protein
MSACENILVNADQTLTKENASTAEATKLPYLMALMDLPTEYGEELTENGIVITVIADSTRERRQNIRMQIDSSIKGNTLEPNKYEKNVQENVHGVQIIYLMVHANKHNSIIMVNTMIMIQWLTLSNYV